MTGYTDSCSVAEICAGDPRCEYYAGSQACQEVTAGPAAGGCDECGMASHHGHCAVCGNWVSVVARRLQHTTTGTPACTP